MLDAIIAYGNASSWDPPTFLHGPKGGGARIPFSAHTMAGRMTDEEREWERKLERNRRAFQAWLERKNEEQKV